MERITNFTSMFGMMKEGKKTILDLIDGKDTSEQTLRRFELFLLYSLAYDLEEIKKNVSYIFGMLEEIKDKN